MDPPEATIRVNIDCDDQADFRRRRLGSQYRDDFPVNPVMGMREGDTRPIELVLRSGQVLISGTVVVTADRGGPPNTDKMMVALVEISDGERELQKEAWRPPTAQVPILQGQVSDSELAALLELGPAEDTPAEQAAPSAAPSSAPQPHSRWPWLVAGAALIGGIVALVVLRREPAAPTPAPAPQQALPVAPAKDTKADALKAKLELADQRMKEGRIVGPGGDYALNILLEAKKLAPDDPDVASRLKAIADRFEQLGNEALAQDALAEAATHFQVVVTAEPSREQARERIREIEAKVRGN